MKARLGLMNIYAIHSMVSENPHCKFWLEKNNDEVWLYFQPNKGD